METYRNWIFKVDCEVKPGEKVFAVGSCPELGNWSSQRALALEPENIGEEGGVYKGTWKGIARLPSHKISFRYCVSVCLDKQETDVQSYAVLCWESHLLPRIVPENKTNVNEFTVDMFGCNQGIEKIDQGWLVKDSVIQLKLFTSDIYSEAIVLWNRKYKDKKVYVKVSAIDMNRKLNKSAIIIDPSHEESTEVELTQLRTMARQSWPLVEVAVMKDDLAKFHMQEQFGTEYTDEMIVFQCRAFEPSSISFLLDYYVEGNPDDFPKYIGCSHILPTSLKENFGVVNQPITSKKQVPIGHLTVHYLIVHPLKEYECDMEVSYARYWKAAWTGLEVGHRGAGNSFHSHATACANIRENTIASLKFAAENGADMVEFDVQLSKDLVPVLYHDFHACISLKRKKQSSVTDNLLEIPIKDLTLDELQSLKVYHRTEKGYDKFSDADLEDHQSFPTLEKAMQVVPDSCGFNIELKWNMKRKDGSYELEHPFELNRFLDIILKIVLESTTRRKIVFSCFHPDICTMIRLKQNRYPVLFLTDGDKYVKVPYEDTRTRSFKQAVYFAESANILGVDVESSTLLNDIDLVQMALDKKQIVFCWGDGNNDKSAIQRLKKSGVHGIIYDKIDVYNTKSKKESIFMCEDKSAQTCILASYKKTHANNGNDPSNSESFSVSSKPTNGTISSPTTFTGVLQKVGS